MKRKYEVWFIQNNKNRKIIEANDRDEARQKFAEENYIIVSNYICAKLKRELK